MALNEKLSPGMLQRQFWRTPEAPVEAPPPLAAADVLAKFKVGQEVKARKLSLNKGAIAPGQEFTGKLLTDPSKLISLESSLKTSPVVSSKIEGDKLIVYTKNSIYEISLLNAGKIQTPVRPENKVVAPARQEKISPEQQQEQMREKMRKSREQLLQSDLQIQSEVTKAIIDNQDFKLLKHYTIIDNKQWFFSDNYNGIIMALVSDEQNPRVFRPRFFRVSGSDHQFKALPGFRRGRTSYIKGDEEDSRHHYVQSAKLDSRIMYVLQSLPHKTDNSFRQRLKKEYLPMPIKKSNGEYTGLHPEDFNFSEKQQPLKNEKWQQIQKEQQRLLKCFEQMNGTNRLSLKDLTEFISTSLPAEFGTSLKQLWQAVPAADREHKIEDLRYDGKVNPNTIKFLDAFERMFPDATEAIFSDQNIATRFEQAAIVPDFSKSPVKTYEKTNGKIKIKIEEFDITSPEGDQLRWAMAQDDKGRVYVDNIYDPRVGIDSYGTPKLKVNMGMLIYKPEDYTEQVLSVKDKYKKSADDNKYYDISSLLELSYPVQQYKAALLKRQPNSPPVK